ncbi:MAG: DUF547 domain-containing protein [Moraxellaceae bacterium]|nr:DUF547 domain-containing protein [Pseudobdellovibrionaceae bacterium]
MKKIMLTVILIFSAQSSLAEIPSFTIYQNILDQYVTAINLPDGGFETHVQYQKIYDEKDGAKNRDEQLKIIEKFDPILLKDKDEALAFWINTYNFFMISKILKDGFKNKKLSINSVKDLGSFFSPYKAFSALDFKVGGKAMSLDQIEKETLLGEAYKTKKWKDARIHFAVNCASVNCPPLSKKIYTPEKINQQLDENITKALKTKRHFHFAENRLYVTYLTKWYDADFNEDYGSVQNFLVQFTSDANLKAKIKTIKSFEYINYDWNLNISENFQ